jgi:uncharacterized Zn finger protein
MLEEVQTDPLPTCPDCGGILHATRAELLTSADVASVDADTASIVLQCLICGYVERRIVDVPFDRKATPA